jgi:hypothetical protein
MGKQMLHVVYVGPRRKWRRRNVTALGVLWDNEMIRVQFDDIVVFPKLAHHWHEFPAKHWKVT